MKKSFVTDNIHIKTLKNNFKFAFTLAEVLITLGIIGVVASMTIPTVINKYQERVTVSKFKKFYSTMCQAYLLSVKDNGYANEWDVASGHNSSTANQIAGYLKPYLRISKDCGTSSGCLGYTQVRLLNGTSHSTQYETSSNYYKVILNDGSYVWWRGSSNWCHSTDGEVPDTCVAIWTDINGKKQPNTIGKDIFFIFITATGVKPAAENCTKTSSGWGCSGYIIQNDNVNYLH